MKKSVNAISIVTGNLHLMIIKAKLEVSRAWDKLQQERKMEVRFNRIDRNNPKLAEAQEYYRECLARLSGLHQMRFEAESCGYIIEQQLPLQLVAQGG